MRGRFAALFGLAAVLALAPAGHAASDKAWLKDARTARKALSHSVAAGYVTQTDEARYLGILGHARIVRNRVPPGRAALLDTVLDLVSRPKSPTGARALILYTTLQENVDYLAQHRIPSSRIDVEGDDGVVYRFFPDSGLVFHPLANASRLNALVSGKHDDEAHALAASLAERVNDDGAWEYEFDFANAHAPWTSGMAQAVMAQALARAGDVELARRAYEAIPGKLDRMLPAGPWIRLYSSTSEAVLNAQLQSAISIAAYADIAGDAAAAAYAARLRATAKAMLPRFDTGHWSRYSLGAAAPGEDSTLEYHDFVVELLRTLKRTDGDDPVWDQTLQRFQQYETEPPELTAPSVTPLVYPVPEDGVRDELTVRFSLSKPSKVVLVIDGKAVDGFTANGGRHYFVVTPRFGFGTHDVRLVARSLDGHSGSADAGSFELARDATPPTVSASKANGRVFWRAKDGESACCRLRLLLRRGSEHRLVVLTRTKGSFAIPKGYWSVTVVARDAAGNEAKEQLGLVIGTAKR